VVRRRAIETRVDADGPEEREGDVFLEQFGRSRFGDEIAALVAEPASW